MMRVIACNAMALFITGYEMDNNTFDKNKQKE